MGRQEIMNRIHSAGDAQPLVEVLSDRRVLVEHHRGVLAYGPQDVCVRVSWGQIHIRGERLCLARMNREQLVICGKIQGVDIFRNGGARYE